MLKNYTTTIPAEKSLAEIETMLGKAGARGIMKKLDEKGNVEALIFTVVTADGELPFKMPCDVARIQVTMTRQKSAGKLKGISWPKLRDKTHATNVGWRIIKDWVAVQLSLIQIDLVDLEQIFLPYAYNWNTEKTFYDSIKEGGFKLLQGGQ